jgi:hypothetical protein
MHATDIVAYTFQAETLCPACVLDRIPEARELSDNSPAMDTEAVLHAVAVSHGIDWEDEYSYDSDEFPKVIFASQIEDERCSDCSETL